MSSAWRTGSWSAAWTVARSQGRLVIGAGRVNSVVARASGLTTGFADDVLAIDTMEGDAARRAVDDRAGLRCTWRMATRGRPATATCFPSDTTWMPAWASCCRSSSTRWVAPRCRTTRASSRKRARSASCAAARNPDNFKAYRLPLGGPLARRSPTASCSAATRPASINAYTGEGIYHAMVTGEHAGTTAGEALATGDVSAEGLAAYERRWRGGSGRRAGRRRANPAAPLRRSLAGRHDHPCGGAGRAALPALRAGGAGEASLRRRRFELTWRFVLARLKMLVRPASVQSPA